MNVLAFVEQIIDKIFLMQHSIHKLSNLPAYEIILGARWVPWFLEKICSLNGAREVSCEDAISVTATIMDTFRNHTAQFSDFINAISADSVKFPGSKYIINKILCRLYGP